MKPKVAIVHDWVTNLGGAERCLESMHRLYPQADLFTLVYKEDAVRQLGFDPDRVHASFLQRLPRATRSYQWYLPLYPMAVEGFDLSRYDLVLSSSWAAAKGVLTRSDQLHICYCHTPIRYAWDLTHEYLAQSGLASGAKGAMARLVMHYLRLWDLSTSSRVDQFVANSHYVARRINRIYRRDATVIHPPVDVNRFTLPARRDDHFLFVSRLVPYKRLDLVVQAFARLGLPLAVIGDGPERKRLERMAPANVRFLGWQPDEVVEQYMRTARALIYAADEDFGIVPVEAQACGTPVIAFGRGGVTETVVPWAEGSQTATGVFFPEQTAEALEAAVRTFQGVESAFSPQAIRANAERFSRERFERDFGAHVTRCWEAHCASGDSSRQGVWQCRV